MAAPSPQAHSLSAASTSDEHRADENAKDLLGGIGDGGERVGGEDGERLELGQALVGGGRVAERRANQDAFDPAEGASGGAPPFHCLLGGDEVAGASALEILTLDATDAHVAIAGVFALELLFANEIRLNPRTLFTGSANDLRSRRGRACRGAVTHDRFIRRRVGESSRAVRR